MTTTPKPGGFFRFILIVCSLTAMSEGKIEGVVFFLGLAYYLKEK